MEPKKCSSDSCKNFEAKERVTLRVGYIWLGSVAWQMQFVGRYVDNSIKAGSEQETRLSQACIDNQIQLSMALSVKAGHSTLPSGTSTRRVK